MRMWACGFSLWGLFMRPKTGLVCQHLSSNNRALDIDFFMRSVLNIHLEDDRN